MTLPSTEIHLLTILADETLVAGKQLYDTRGQSEFKEHMKSQICFAFLCCL